MPSAHPTHFHRKTTSGAPKPDLSFGLAPELARKARGRVKWFAVAMAAMSLILRGARYQDCRDAVLLNASLLSVSRALVGVV